MTMKHVNEYIKGLCYKIRMMGIPVVGCTYVLGDNQLVLKNTLSPNSKLKKKSNSIAYHHVREGVAHDEWKTTYIKTDEKRADLCTKNLGPGPKRDGFLKSLLHYIVSDDTPPKKAMVEAVRLVKLILGD